MLEHSGELDAKPAGPGSGSAAFMPFGAPRVQNPIRSDSFVQKPCQSLTAQQVQGVHEDSVPYVFAEDSDRSVCVWPYAQAGTRIQVSWNTKMASDPRQPNGLDFYYSRRNDSLSNDKFVPSSVDGYPAAFIGVASQNRADTCRLAVGVRDDLLVTVTYSGDPNTVTVDQDCVDTKQVVRDIVDNAKSKA
jgi:hypothetical protein